MSVESHGRGIADAMAANDHASDPLELDERRWLVLDESGPAPQWVIVSAVAARPARMSGRRYQDWPEAAQWTAERIGWQPSLIPVGARLWLIAGGPK